MDQRDSWGKKGNKTLHCSSLPPCFLPDIEISTQLERLPRLFYFLFIFALFYLFSSNEVFLSTLPKLLLILSLPLCYSCSFTSFPFLHVSSSLLFAPTARPSMNNSKTLQDDNRKLEVRLWSLCACKISRFILARRQL